MKTGFVFVAGSKFILPVKMSIKSDKWIRRMAEEQGMIEPFEPRQVRSIDDRKIVSYGVSSYGYDIRCADEFKIFTNINSTIVDPKNFDENSFVDVKSDVCIIPPHTKHSIGIFDDSIAFNILIRGSTFQSTFFQSLTEDSALAHFFAHVLYRKTEGNYLIFHTANDPQIREMLENLYIEYLGHEKYSYTFLNSMLILLWAMLLRYHGGNIESILAKDTSGNSMTDILNYLSQHYQTATLRETASHFGYSSSHFSTLIKEGTGQTFLQIIRSIKLEQACRALRETSLSNIAICELVGYDSPEHFMRTFKKNYGMTPGEYRKKYHEQES